MSVSIQLKREELERFIGNDYETIIKFEELFRTVEPFTDDGLEQLQFDVGTALAKANQAINQINTLSTTFLGLSDVNITSYTANRVPYESASAIVDSANFTFDGNDLQILGTTDTPS